MREQPRMTSIGITKKLGIEHLTLYRGEGYMYFVFDDGKRFDTHMVMVPRVNDLSFSQWKAEAKAFIDNMEKQYG